MRDFARTCINAYAAASALRRINHHSTGIFVNTQRLKWASYDAWVVFALGTQVGKLCAWYKHEDANAGGFRPNLALVAEGAGDFTLSAATTFGEIPSHPDSVVFFVIPSQLKFTVASS